MKHIHSGRYKVIPTKNSVDINFYKRIGCKTKNKIIHNILLLDCSISMGSNMRKMKDEVTKILHKFNNDNYVSIICYSGHNDSYVLVECVKSDDTSYKMSGIFDKVQEINTISLTVMSEPLNQSLDLCLKLENIVDMSNIILFTDGCLVTYDIHKEENDCIKIAEVLNSKNAIVSTIGFGQYYDRDFLNKLSSKGLYCHIDDIISYNKVVTKIIKNSMNKTKGIVITSAFKLVNITTGEMGFSITVYNDNVVASIEGELDYNKAEVQTPYKDMVDIMDSFYYILARNYMNHDDIDTYEHVLRLLIGDVALFKATKNTYSFIEKGNALSLINDCIIDKTNRFKAGRKFIIETEDDEQTLSVLEVLSIIMEDKQSTLYWNRDTKYNYTGMKTEQVESSNEFKINKNKKLFKVVDCAISDKKLNISVNVIYDGFVYDKASVLKRPANIFRRYNIINSGNLNVQYIYAELSEDLFNTLTKHRITVNIFEELPNGGVVFEIDLNDLKTANKRIFKSMSKEDVITNMLDLENFKCKQSVLNKIIKNLLGEQSKLDFDESKSLLDKEICKQLNIDENGTYRANMKISNNEQFEIYPSLHCEWNIKFDKKNNQEKYFKEAESIIAKIRKEHQLDVLIQFKKELSQNIKSLSFKINCIRIASAMINKQLFIYDVITNKSKTIHDKIMNKNVVVGETIEVSERVFNNTIFTQKKWIQLLKCS